MQRLCYRIDISPLREAADLSGPTTLNWILPFDRRAGADFDAAVR